MAEPGQHVLMDTDVIIESHRTDCWKHLVHNYKLDTVEKCAEECATGNQRRRNPVPVDMEALEEMLKPKKVDLKHIAQLQLQLAAEFDLHDGEKHLLAYGLTLRDAWLVCSADHGAINAGASLGILDRFVALEDLTKGAGLRVNLRENFTRKYMKGKKTMARISTLD